MNLLNQLKLRYPYDAKPHSYLFIDTPLGEVEFWIKKEKIHLRQQNEWIDPNTERYHYISLQLIGDAMLDEDIENTKTIATQLMKKEDETISDAELVRKAIEILVQLLNKLEPPF